ncbi:MAG: viscotoxin-A3 [Eggerthellaceae bacterium]|jgi:hypothetical protein
MVNKNASNSESIKAQVRDDDRARKEQQAQVRDYLTGLPRFNLGALFMPPIWGPAHGMIATLLWYPAWLLADNVFFSAYSLRTPMSFVFAALTFVILFVFAFYFSYAMQPRAAIWCIQRGKTKEQFQRRQRIWGVVSIVIAAILLAFATYYNLNIRTPMGA